MSNKNKNRKLSKIGFKARINFELFDEDNSKIFSLKMFPAKKGKAIIDDIMDQKI